MRIRMGTAILSKDRLLNRLIVTLSALILLAGCMDSPVYEAQGQEPDLGSFIDSPAGTSLSGDPVINRFSVSPSTIAPGEKGKLSWNVTNATSVSINQDIGIVEPVGSIEVSPMVQTAYIITATNEKGSTFAKVTLTVQAQGANTLPVIIEFITAPIVPRRNQPARLIWKTRGATLVTIDNVPVQANGDKMIMLSSPTIFTITATNSYGSEMKYLSVQVND